MDKLLKESKAKYLKGSFLAITANSGGFRLCELGEDLNEDALEAKVKFLIPAGVRYSDNCFYKPLITGKEEVVSCGLILTDVKLSTLTRLLLQLPDSEIDRVTSAINESYAVLQSVQPLTTTEDQLLVPKTYCNKDENNFIIDNAESFAESFDNYTLNNLNLGVEVESIIQNLDINNLPFSENFNLNKGDVVTVDSATQEVGLSTSESDSGSLYIPSNASIASSSITETKCKRKQSECKFKIPKQRRLSKIIESSNNCVDSDKEAACIKFEKNYVTSQEEKQCPSVEIGQNKINENNVPKQAAIYFSASKKKECNSKRVYDKKHVCLYCNKLVCKITRHLSSTHASECEVSKLLSLPMNDKERKNGFVELMRMGDFYHNSHVLAIEEGELILVRRPSEEESRLVSYSDFGPCPGCTGFMLKKHLWHHTRECFSFKKGNDANRHILQQCNALMAAVLHPNISEAFSKNVLSKMNDDDIGKIAKCDETIISFGMMMVEKHEDEQYELTRQSMRQLARLLIELRKVTNYPDSNLKHYIKPICFDDIVLAVKNISGINNRSEKAIPSLALKLGYHLQKCAAILRGKALRLSNSEDDKSYRDFLDLYNLEWQTRISSSALNVMNQRNMNSVSMIPLTSDLMKINSALTEELKARLNEANKSELDTESWLKLAKVTLCRLIMFNKKRGGEAARITIQQYASKPDWNAENAENFLESLSELERHLVDKLTLIEIRGKRRKVVPVLLTEDVNKAITVLINTREAAGVSKYNPYIFARPYCSSSSLEALRGSDCLRDFVKTLNLQKPKLVSSTKLRKYIATTSQVFNLHENEVDWLARHLGHDINVHRNFYRIHHSAIELTKVSKLLMAVDKGKINQFAGKTLDEINVEDLFDDGSEIDEHEKDDESDVDDPDNDPNVTEDVLPERATPSAFESMMTADNIPASSSARKPSIGTRKGNKTPWNTDEKKIVLTFFRDNIKHKSLPGKTQCLKCINDNKKLLGHRSWTKIKDFVRNHLKSLNHTV